MMSELSDAEEAKPTNGFQDQAGQLLQTYEPPLKNGGAVQQNEELIPSEEGTEDDLRILKDKRDLMKKNITLSRGIAIVLNSIIGTGIFITPNRVTRGVGSPAASILFWLAGGLLAAAGGLTYAELGTTYPQSGGMIVYLKRIYPDIVGFLRCWLILYLVTSVAVAIGVQSLTRYLFAMLYEDPADVPVWMSKGLAVVVIICIVSLISLKPTLYVQTLAVISWMKVSAVLVIIIAGLVHLAKGNTQNISQGFNGTNTDFWRWDGALSSIIWSYSGFANIGNIASEVQNPERNLPIIFLVTVPAVTALYTLTILSYHIALPVHELINPIPVASVFGQVTMGPFG